MGDRYFAEKVAKLNSPLNIIWGLSYNDNLLDEAEEFKSKFIREDEVIYSLKNDINGVGNSIRKKW